MAAQQYDYAFKLILIGDSKVGKSALMSRYSDNAFTNRHISTDGVEFKVRTIEIEGKRVKLQIWDTADLKGFYSFNSSYYRDAHGIVAVYDTTNLASFRYVKKLLNEIELRNLKDVSKILVGNKSDISGRRAVPYTTGMSFATHLSIPFLETSAKTPQNVDQAFERIVTAVKDRLDSQKADENRVNSQKIDGARWFARMNVLLQVITILLTLVCAALAIYAIPSLASFHSIASNAAVVLILIVLVLFGFFIYCFYRTYKCQLV